VEWCSTTLHFSIFQERDGTNGDNLVSKMNGFGLGGWGPIPGRGAD
jgi:hypothetical protein